MRSLREPKALTIQPMRCRSDQNIAEILSKRPQQNSFQVVHFTSARRFDDGQGRHHNSSKLSEIKGYEVFRVDSVCRYQCEH